MCNFMENKTNDEFQPIDIFSLKPSAIAPKSDKPPVNTATIPKYSPEYSSPATEYGVEGKHYDVQDNESYTIIQWRTGFVGVYQPNAHCKPIKWHRAVYDKQHLKVTLDYDQAVPVHLVDFKSNGFKMYRTYAKPLMGTDTTEYNKSDTQPKKELKSQPKAEYDTLINWNSLSNLMPEVDISEEWKKIKKELDSKSLAPTSTKYKQFKNLYGNPGAEILAGKSNLVLPAPTTESISAHVDVLQNSIKELVAEDNFNRSCIKQNELRILMLDKQVSELSKSVASLLAEIVELRKQLSSLAEENKQLKSKRVVTKPITVTRKIKK